jgi:hypothetical protein
MTDDLVKRLRRADTCIFPTERDRCHCGEAADRILKLEAALAKIAQHDMQAIAMDALRPGERIRKALDAE